MSFVEVLNQLRKIAGKFRRVEGVDIYETATAKFADFAGQSVDPDAWQTILEKTGRGRIGDFHVRSPNTSFKVQIKVDGTVQLEKTYAELRNVQQNSGDISAFAERDEEGDLTGYYVASIRDVRYYTSILLRVQNTGGAAVTFSQLFAKYETLGGD